MSYMALIGSLGPITWDVEGQDHIVTTLKTK